MGKKFLISRVVIFVVRVVGSFVVHGVWLGADYAALANSPQQDAVANKEIANYALMIASCWKWLSK